MIVSELIERLLAMPQDARVIVDLSQNEYADMCGIETEGATGNVVDACYLDRDLGGTFSVHIAGDVTL